jgi:hypothetical protein
MSEVTIKRSYPLPLGFCVTFQWGRAGTPRVPVVRQARARRKFLEAYAAVRREFFTEVAAVIGGAVLVVDTDGDEGIKPPTKQ